MNAYLNQVIQQFQHGGLFNAEWWKSVDLSGYIIPAHEYWDRLIEFPAQEEEEIRFLHEEYETELHECVYCDRLYEAERDLDGWFESQYCEECYWDLNGEGRD